MIATREGTVYGEMELAFDPLEMFLALLDTLEGDSDTVLAPSDVGKIGWALMQQCKADFEVGLDLRAEKQARVKP